MSVLSNHSNNNDSDANNNNSNRSDNSPLQSHHLYDGKRWLPNQLDLRHEISRLNDVVSKERLNFKKAYMEMADGYSDNIVRMESMATQVKEKEIECRELLAKVNEQQKTLDQARRATGVLIKQKNETISNLYDQLFEYEINGVGKQNEAISLPKKQERELPSTRSGGARKNRNSLVIEPQISAGLPKRHVKSWNKAQHAGQTEMNDVILPLIPRVQSFYKDMPSEPESDNRESWTIEENLSSPTATESKETLPSISPQQQRLQQQQEFLPRPPSVSRQPSRQQQKVTQHLQRRQVREVSPRQVLSQRLLNRDALDEQSVSTERLPRIAQQQHHQHQQQQQQQAFYLPRVQSSSTNIFHGSQNSSVEMKSVDTKPPPKLRSRKRVKISETKMLITQQDSEEFKNSSFLPTPPTAERQRRPY